MDMSDDLIKILLERGYVEFVGKNQIGDPLYKITPLFYEEQKEVVEWMKKVDSDLINSLWFKGFIDLMMGEDGRPYVYLTEKSDTWVDTKELDENEKAMMYIIYSTSSYIQEE